MKAEDIGAVEELVHDTLWEHASEQSPPGPGFADRVLAVRRRRRAGRFVAAATATAAVVAVAVGVPMLDPGKDGAAQTAGSSGVHGHPDQSPPRDMIAAGNTVLAAYSTAKIVPQSGGFGVKQRTYWLLDPETGKYRKDDRWSYAAVAPGLRIAAVLERGLPASRIGLLDLATGEVERWIPVAHGVGGLAFSPDGGKLVATTYKENPDLLKRAEQGGIVRSDKRDAVTSTVKEAAGNAGKGKASEFWFGTDSRTGFSVLDVASGKEHWNRVTDKALSKSRDDFVFVQDGTRVSMPAVGGDHQPMLWFFDLRGKRTDPPAGEAYLEESAPAGSSSRGPLVPWSLVAPEPGKTYKALRDPHTGKGISQVRGTALLAWADDRRLIAWEGAEGSARHHLVLATAGSGKVVPLSGWTSASSGWQPVFARR